MKTLACYLLRDRFFLIARDILNKNVYAVLLNELQIIKVLLIDINFTADLLFAFREVHIADVHVVERDTAFEQLSDRLRGAANQEYLLVRRGLTDDVDGFFYREEADTETVGFCGDTH